MIRKSLAAIGLSAAMATTLIAGCSAPANDPNASNQSEQQSQNIDKSQYKLDITESGYSIDGSGYVHYAVTLKNDMPDGAMFPVLKITGKDAAGNVVFADEQTLLDVQPGATTAWAGQAGNGTAPDTVEFNVSVAETNWTTSEKPAELEVVNSSANDGGYGTVDFVGEVKNNSDETVDQAALIVILRNDAGEIVGGYNGFTNNVPANGTTAFDVLGYEVPEYSKMDVIALDWL